MHPPRCQECVTLDAAHPEVGEMQIRHLCIKLLPGWSGLDASSLQASVGLRQAHEGLSLSKSHDDHHPLTGGACLSGVFLTPS